jgi:hypothetical protein
MVSGRRYMIIFSGCDKYKTRTDWIVSKKAETFN